MGLLLNSVKIKSFLRNFTCFIFASIMCGLNTTEIDDNVEKNVFVLQKYTEIEVWNLWRRQKLVVIVGSFTDNRLKG